MKNNCFILVPSLDFQGLPVDNQEVLEYVKLQMTELFGGCNYHPLSGCYKANSGMIICETNIKVESFADNLRNLGKFIELALFVKDKLSQECVAICVNGELKLV